MTQAGRTGLRLSALRRNYTQPQALYTLFRDHDPIYFDRNSDCWIVTDHAAILTILSDPRFFSKPGVSSPTQHSAFHLIHSTISSQLLFMDGEEHRRMQEVIQNHLVQVVKTIEPFIVSVVRTQMLPFLATGTMDIVRDLAAPVTLLVIAHVLGLPTTDNEQQLEQLERWSDTFADVTSGYVQDDGHHLVALKQFLAELIAERTRAPQPGFINDCLQLTDIFASEALIANLMMLLSAGRITTKKLLGNGLPLLFHQWAFMRAESQKQSQFLNLVCEEMLRVVTPTRYLARWANEDVDLSAAFPGEHLIRREQKVLLFLEAGNYDPRAFAQPEQVDLQRRPNKHLSFGYGKHFCPGAALARLETRAVLRTLLSFPELNPTLDTRTAPGWNPNPNLGGFSSCPVRLY